MVPYAKIGGLEQQLNTYSKISWSLFLIVVCLPCFQVASVLYVHCAPA